MFEAFSVSVKLKLIDAVTAPLIALASQFSALQNRVNSTNAALMATEARLKSIRGLAIGGAFALGAGAAGLGLFEAPIEAARRYELAFTKFKNLNLGDAINAQADKFARGSRLMGISATQLMQTLSESVGILGNYKDAAQLVPMLAQVNAANAAVYGDKVGQLDEGSSRALMQFIDRRGGTKDETSFRRNLDLAEKMVTGSGGFIKFRDLASFSQQAGTAFRGLSDQGILNYAMILQEQGGNRAGTALMSLYQNLIAGRTPKKTMEMLEAIGLGRIGQAQAGTFGGRTITTTKFSLFPEFAEKLQSDPVAFFRETWLPALAKRGITSQADIIRMTNDLLSNRTASGQGTILSTQLFQILRDANLTSNAKGFAETIAQWRKDPNSKFAELSARWQDTLIELGEDVLPVTIKATQGLSSSLSGLSDVMSKFPKLTSGLALGAGGLFALGVIGGTLSLVTAGIRGLGLVLSVGSAVGLGGKLAAAAAGLGQLALGVGVFASAYAATRAIAEAITPKDWTFGSWLYNVTHPNDPGMRPDVVPGHGVSRGTVSRWLAPMSSSKPVQVHTDISIDGKKVASAVSTHTDKALQRPQIGPNLFDPSMTLLPAGQ